MSLYSLTTRYIDAFNDRDIETVSSMLSDNAVLEDPANTFVGKQDVIEEVKGLFSAETLIFSPTGVFVDEDNSTSVIEFLITVNDDKLAGVDIITWEDNLMTSLRAYVYPAKGN